jgi:hypothetical protein
MIIDLNVRLTKSTAVRVYAQCPTRCGKLHTTACMMSRLPWTLAVSKECVNDGK